MTEENTEDQSFEDAFDEFAGGTPAEEESPPEPEDKEPVEEEGGEQPRDELGRFAAKEDAQEEIKEKPEVSEVDQYRKKAEEWEHRYKSDMGRQSALQRKIQEQEEQLRVLRESQKPMDNPEGSGMSDQEWNTLKDDFPEVADAIEKRLNGMAKKYEQRITELQQKLTPIQQSIEQQAREHYRAEQFNALEHEHPDYKEIAQAKEFREWVGSLPQHIQQMMGSDNAADAAYLISNFKLQTGYGKKEPPQNEVQQRRDRQLRQAQTLPSRGVRQTSNLPPEDDYEAAFDYFASK